MAVRTPDERSPAGGAAHIPTNGSASTAPADAAGALERAPFGVTWVGPDGTILYANPAQLQLLRCPPDAYAGRPFAGFVPPEQARLAARIVAGEQLAGVQLDLRRPDGTVAHLLVETSPAYEDGELVANVCFAHDLSEHDAALAHVVEAEQRRALANSVPFLTWLADADGKLTYVNPRWTAYTGCAPAECVAGGWEAVLYPGDPPFEPEAFARRAEHVVRHRLRRADGEYRWHQTCAVPVRIGGEFRGWIGSSIDIHAQVVAEEALRESEERFRRIVETAYEGVLMLDEEANITYANGRLGEMLGYARDELAGRRLHSLMDDEMAARADVHLARRRQGVSEHFEFRFRHRDGGDVWVIVGATPLWRSDGAYDGSLALITDITERKRQEQDLRDSQARIRAAQEAGRVGTFEWDVRTNQVVWDGVEPIHGLPPGAFGGSFDAFLADVHPEDRAHVLAAIEKAVDECGALELEYRIVPPDGSVRWVAGKGTAFADESGRTVRVAGTCQDITQRKEAELALRRGEERYRSLFNSIDQGFCVVEVFFDDEDRPLDYRFVEANPAFEEHTGLHNAIGRTARELVPGLEEHWFEIYGRVARTGVAERFTNEAKTMDERWFDVYAFRVGEPEERKVAILFNDFTERQRHQIALRESEERYRSLSELVPAMVTLSQPDGRIIYANQRVIDYTGFSMEELQQGRWTDIFHPEDLAANRDMWLAAINRGDSIEGEFRARRYDGVYCWHLGRVAPVRDDAGRIVYWIAAHVDIDARKRAERAVSERVRQQASVAALGQLALASDDPQAVMDEAVEQLAACLNVDFARVLELQPDGDELLMRAGHGWHASAVEGVSRVPAGPDSQAGYTLRSDGPVIVRDLREETRFGLPAALREVGVISGMSTVIHGAGGNPFGVLTVHTRERREFTPEDLHYLASVASIIGQSLQRRASEDALRERVSQQESVARLGQAAVSADLDSLLDHAVRELSENLGADLVKVLELLPDGESLRLRAGCGWREGIVGTLVLSARESQAGYSLLSSRPVIVDDLRHEHRFAGPGLLNEHGVISGMSTIVRADQGHPWGVVGVHTKERRTFSEDDLTYLESVASILGQAVQRHAADDALRAALADTEAARALLDTLLKAAPVGFVVLDREGRFVLVNDEAARISGIAAEDHIGRRIDDLLPGLAPQSAYIARVLQGEVVRDIEVSGETPAQPGVTRSWLASYYPVYEGRGVIAAGIAFSEITERRRIEDELRHQHQLTRTITDNATVGLMMMDALGRITFMNPAAEEITGYRAEDVIGEVAHDKVHFLRPDGRPYPMEECPIDGANARLTPLRGYEDVFVRPDGSFYDVVCNLAPIAAIGGVPSGMLIEFRDATREKRAQQEREELLADLSRALAAKDEFLGLVSHELKTPITTIYGNAEVLRRRGDRLDDQSRAEAITDISQESERLHRIIDNLLVLARLERGQQLASEPVLVHRLAQRLIDEHRHRFPHRQITLQSDGDVGPIAGEPLYIEQVIRNLLSNAEKYSPPDLPIEVETRSDGHAVSLRVLDRGPGFPAEEAERIFTPFYRSSATAAHASGVGVGLAVCKRLIEAQQGEMWARPRPDGGADIGFSLPLAEPFD